MSTSIQETFADTVKSQLASQQDQWAATVNAALEQSMGFCELQMKAARESFRTFAHASQKMLAAKSPQDFFAIDTAEVQEEFRRMLAYTSELSGLASKFQHEINEIAQGQFSKNCEATSALYKGNSVNSSGGLSDPSEFTKVAAEKVREGFEQWAAAATSVFQTVNDSLKLGLPESAPAPKKPAKANHKAEARA